MFGQFIYANNYLNQLKYCHPAFLHKTLGHVPALLPVKTTSVTAVVDERGIFIVGSLGVN
jgi:hypothetical protein